MYFGALCACVRVPFGKGPKTRFWWSPEEEEEKEEKEDAERERLCVHKKRSFFVSFCLLGEDARDP